MLAGLLLDEFYILFSISDPFSLTPIMLIINTCILLGGILVYLRDRSAKHSEITIPGLHPSVLVLLTIPILTVAGAMLVNVYENNLIMLFMIITIPSLFALGVMSKKLVPSDLYPLALLMIAISLLIHYSLISTYILALKSKNSPTRMFLCSRARKTAAIGRLQIHILAIRVMAEYMQC